MKRNIDQLLEKYWEGTTSLAEEQAIRAYFLSDEVDERHRDLAPLFGFYVQAEQEMSSRTLALKSDKKRAKRIPRLVSWIAIAACLVVAIRVAFVQQPIQEDLGTYQNPQEAMMATQQALGFLSEELNKGISSIEYINQYEQSKDLIFNP